MKIRVALAQILVVAGAREGNFRRIESALQAAARGGVDLVCLPEMAILGWVNPQAHHMAEPIPGADLERLQALARKYRCMLSIGLAEREGEQLYDSAVLIGAEGRLLLKHRKINILTELMEPPYTPGAGVQVCDTELGRVGLMICADTFQEDLLKEMSALQPDLVLVPYGWVEEAHRWPAHGLALEKTVSHAAKVIGAPLVGTNAVGAVAHGPWAGRIFGGQSLIVDKAGGLLVKAHDRDRHVLESTLTL